MFICKQAFFFLRKLYVAEIFLHCVKRSFDICNSVYKFTIFFFEFHSRVVTFLIGKTFYIPSSKKFMRKKYFVTPA